MEADIKFDYVIVTEMKLLINKELQDYERIYAIEEEQALIDSLLKQNRNLRITRAGWDDPEFDWSKCKFLIIRSIWNYIEKSEEFKAWIERVGSS